MQVLAHHREAMDVATEEMGELLQAFGKIGRFGLSAVDSVFSPVGQTYDNLADVQRESVDVVAAMILFQFVGLMEPADEKVMDAVRSKCMKMALRFQAIDPRAFMAFVTEKLEG